MPAIFETCPACCDFIANDGRGGELPKVHDDGSGPFCGVCWDEMMKKEKEES